MIKNLLTTESLDSRRFLLHLLSWHRSGSTVGSTLPLLSALYHKLPSLTEAALSFLLQEAELALARRNQEKTGQRTQIQRKGSEKMFNISNC